MLDAWVAGIQGLLQVRELIFLSLGMGIGLVFGALPGLGGIIGTVSVLAVLPVAKQLGLLFGPPEFFLLSILALITVAGSLSGRMLRGLLTGGIGLMIATIGYDSVTGTTRFAGGIEYL